MLVCGRNAETSAALIERLLKLSSKAPPEAWPLQRLQEMDREFDLIVNTTPVGMVPNINTSPWPDGVRFP